MCIRDRRIDEDIDEVSVIGAEPDEHPVGAVGVALVLKGPSDALSDTGAQLLVYVVVSTQLLDDLPGGEPEFAETRCKCGDTRRPVHADPSCRCLLYTSRCV